MILDLQRFIANESAGWKRLEEILDRLERSPGRAMGVEELREFHALYQKTAADLTKIETFAAEWDLLHYLETLVARAYAEIHETRKRSTRFTPLHWFLGTFPRTFRRHSRAFWLTLAVTVVGTAFGAGAILFDLEAKEILMPFGHLQGKPHERVAFEEHHSDRDRLEGMKGSFSAMLMTHNTRVSILTMSLGMTWGLGTIMMLFYNGIILGAVGMDYIHDGQTRFLFGWLLPHGSIEIPAILLAGQAGFVIAGALIGWRSRLSIGARLRRVAPDILTLILGVSVMLVWAGIVEAFFSQYHEPVIPYSVKIAFGALELAALAVFLARSGRSENEPTSD